MQGSIADPGVSPDIRRELDKLVSARLVATRTLGGGRFMQLGNHMLYLLITHEATTPETSDDGLNRPVRSSVHNYLQVVSEQLNGPLAS